MSWPSHQNMLQHAAQSHDFGMFVVRGAVPLQFVEVLDKSVPLSIADVDESFGNNQSLVGSSKSRFYNTWQAVWGRVQLPLQV